jgi:hypothetical protein
MYAAIPFRVAIAASFVSRPRCYPRVKPASPRSAQEAELIEAKESCHCAAEKHSLVKHEKIAELVVRDTTI